MKNVNHDVLILCFVPDQWDTLWMSRHYILYHLSRYYNVIFVSPRLHWRMAYKNFINTSSHGLRRITNSFYTYSPSIFYPTFHNNIVLTSISDFYFCKKLSIISRKFKYKHLILYMWRPDYANFVGKFNEDLVCYHIDDEYSFSKDDMPISKSEIFLLENSDLVFIHSNTLLEKKGHYNSSTFYVPNGVDFEIFETLDKKYKCSNAFFNDIPHPRVGYVGIIKNQLNLSLLYKIASIKKDWSFVFVGPINNHHFEIFDIINALKNLNNVFFLGEKKRHELPHYINQLDVCLMCYQLNDYTKFIFPLKLFEYLACGKPVVSSYLKNLHEFESVLYFADDDSDWINKIQFALETNNVDLCNERIQIARANSWSMRASKIRDQIDKKLLIHAS
jgi:glycosyltransferase involved in cell wall biosynthesis